ncbi:MAG: hypothetical protein HC782_00595 [Gammaproteobacteria bacterium]|nr:hypothetical protein [Gammaproteobacteria bacterium]
MFADLSLHVKCGEALLLREQMAWAKLAYCACWRGLTLPDSGNIRIDNVKPMHSSHLAI